ncbi:MAG: hypothetical protein WCH98_21590, partial [Verrucomicrobiota bacterium]
APLRRVLAGEVENGAHRQADHGDRRAAALYRAARTRGLSDFDLCLPARGVRRDRQTIVAAFDRDRTRIGREAHHRPMCEGATHGHHLETALRLVGGSDA